MEATVTKRPMTWEEQVQWVMRNTDVELENLYIVEEIAKPTTPTIAVTTVVDGKAVVSYETEKTEDGK